MAERQSPKAELVATLDAMKMLMARVENPRLVLAQLAGLLEHAQVLALKVGEMAKARKEKGAPSARTEKGPGA